MGDIYTRLMPLPIGMHGMTIVDSNGDYNVYINIRLEDHGRRVALIHELRHIRRGDFVSNDPITKVENF